MYKEAVKTFVRDTQEWIEWHVHIWGPKEVTPTMWNQFDSSYPVLAWFASMNVTAAQMDARSIERRHLKVKRALPQTNNFGGGTKKHENQAQTLRQVHGALDFADAVETVKRLRVQQQHTKMGERAQEPEAQDLPPPEQLPGEATPVFHDDEEEADSEEDGRAHDDDHDDDSD